MSKFDGRGRRSRAEVREIVTAYRQSGLSAVRFAAQRAIPISTLYSYLTANSKRQARSKLIPVRIRSGAGDASGGASTATIAVELPGAVTLWAPMDICSARLAELIAAIR